MERFQEMTVGKLVRTLCYAHALKYVALTLWFVSHFLQ